MIDAPMRPSANNGIANHILVVARAQFWRGLIRIPNDAVDNPRNRAGAIIENEGFPGQ